MNESHAGAVTTHFSGVTISTSVIPTGCRADEDSTMVKSCSVMARPGFTDFPPNKLPKDPGFKEAAISMK